MVVASAVSAFIEKRTLMKGRRHAEEEGEVKEEQEDMGGEEVEVYGAAEEENDEEEEEVAEEEEEEELEEEDDAVDDEEDEDDDEKDEADDVEEGEDDEEGDLFVGDDGVVEAGISGRQGAHGSNADAEADDMLVLDETELKLRQLDLLSDSLVSIRWLPALPPPLSSASLAFPLPLPSSSSPPTCLVVRPSLRDDGQQRNGAVRVAVEALEAHEEDRAPPEASASPPSCGPAGGSGRQGAGGAASLADEAEGTALPDVFAWLAGTRRPRRREGLPGADLRAASASGRSAEAGDAQAEVHALRGDSQAAGGPVASAAAQPPPSAAAPHSRKAQTGGTSAGDLQLARREGAKPRGAGQALAVVEGEFAVRPWQPRRLARLKKAEAPDTAGAKWFHLPAPELTPELKRDLSLLQLRNVMDPKRHYRAADSKKPPKHFQVGTVVGGAADFFSGRLTRREQRRSIAEEVLHDAGAKAYRKRKYAELQAAAERHGRKRLVKRADSRKPVWARSAPK